MVTPNREKPKEEEELATEVQRNFQSTVSFVAHLDGKLLEHLHDSLAIVVSGLNVEKLLGIFKLPV